jgi:hypothetical protein
MFHIVPHGYIIVLWDPNISSLGYLRFAYSMRNQHTDFSTNNCPAYQLDPTISTSTPASLKGFPAAYDPSRSGRPTTPS